MRDYVVFMADAQAGRTIPEDLLDNKSQRQKCKAMTEFRHDDPSIRWDNSQAAELVSEYDILYVSSRIYEAYLFALMCYSSGINRLLGSATTENEAIDLLQCSGQSKIICLVSDDITPDCGAEIARRVKETNAESRTVLLVNDPVKYHSLSPAQNLFSAICSSSSIGRGGLYQCLEALLVYKQYYVDSLIQRALNELEDFGFQALSNREKEVLDCVAKGLANKEIASQIFIAEKTVRDYVSSILAKLGVSSRAGAAAWAIRHGMTKE